MPLASKRLLVLRTRYRALPNERACTAPPLCAGGNTGTGAFLQPPCHFDCLSYRRALPHLPSSLCLQCAISLPPYSGTLSWGRRSQPTSGNSASGCGSCLSLPLSLAPLKSEAACKKWRLSATCAGAAATRNPSLLPANKGKGSSRNAAPYWQNALHTYLHTTSYHAPRFLPAQHSSTCAG